MSVEGVDAKSIVAADQIASFGHRGLEGGAITRDEAMWLFGLENSADIHSLLSWGNRIREHYKGNKIHLCSIVNAKAGACSENCSLSRVFTLCASYGSSNSSSGILAFCPFGVARE